MSQPKSLEPGAVFARDFRIVRPLRAGGMGAVYVAEQISTGKQRALKLMAPELVHNPEVRERFVREAKAASKIESDHVVETVTAGVDDETGAPYIVMELLRGEELADAVVKSGPLPVADVAEILAQIGHALEQAHAHGIVHRDLKPENIYLCVSKRRDVNFTAKVLDFGIAKLVADGMQKTGTQPLGSPLFMAPEQTDRTGKICPATDVWALGLIAFYLLTGKSYWRGAEGESLNVLLREIIVDPIDFATKRAQEFGVADKLPVGFDGWFARCVDRDVDKRFKEAGEAVRAFADLAHGGPSDRKLVINTSAIEASAASASTETLELAATAYVGEPSGPKPAAAEAATTAGAVSVSQPLSAATAGPPEPRRRSLAPYAVGALAVGALAAGGYYFAKGPPADEPRGAAMSAARTAAAGPSASAAPSASGAGVAASYTPPVAPDDPRCPKGMIFHDAGSTVMGAKDLPDWTEAKVTHRVQVSAFCLDQTEVTVRAYEDCVAKGVCERTPDDVDFDIGIDAAEDAQEKARLEKKWAALKQAYKPLCNARKPERLDHPINCADWAMADKYCTWKGARLPSEAEWEMAARGPEQRDYPWGNDAPDATRVNAGGSEFKAWVENANARHPEAEMTPNAMYSDDDGHAGTAAVGSFPKGATPAGVHDLAGNVLEWTADWFGPYNPAVAVDPKGPPAGETRATRGGAFNSTNSVWVRGAFRWGALPKSYNHGIGFRCAASPSGDRKPGG